MEVSFEEFCKTDLRVGLIRGIEEVPKSDKLWKLSVDLGEPEYRTILSGLKQSYPDKEVLLGQSVVVVANLPVRKMMGFISTGMILCSKDSNDGSIIILSALGTPGSKIG